MEDLITNVKRLSRRALFGVAARVGLMLGASSLAGVTTIVTPGIAFAQCDCISCIGTCVNPGPDQCVDSACAGTDCSGATVICHCIVCGDISAQPVFECANFNCFCRFC